MPGRNYVCSASRRIGAVASTLVYTCVTDTVSVSSNSASKYQKHSKYQLCMLLCRSVGA